VVNFVILALVRAMRRFSGCETWTAVASHDLGVLQIGFDIARALP
jgi:hypothetical protein